VTAVSKPTFTAAMEASRVLYNFLSLGVVDTLPQLEYLAGPGVQSFCPSASMLTSLDTVPEATATEIPPLYNHGPLEAALRGGHGKYVFSADNEVHQGIPRSLSK